MRRFLAVLAAFVALAAFAPSFAAGARNPAGQGPPSQECQAFLEAEGHTPGKSANSPGSPFDEEGFGKEPEGGTGGRNYSEKSQYDVACFQVNH